MSSTVSRVFLVWVVLFAGFAGTSNAQEHLRPREAGIRIGTFPPGPWNAITDVPGVLVGHATLIRGDSIRTGVTAILPHDGDLFRDRVRAAIVVGNGFGKLVGLSQVQELGELETPVLLTGTLSVFRAADALVDTLLLTAGNENIRSINPVVGETNDGFLSDIRARPIGSTEVRAALRNATSGPVLEGAVGAGTGTTALGYKGGIGTASRRVTSNTGMYTVGVLVQTNFGGSLVIDGVPVGRMLKNGSPHDRAGGGSIMLVIATDAPLEHRQLERLASRSFGGLSRAGASLSHGSGDYAIAFTVSGDPPDYGGGFLSDLFVGVMEATEEAIVASLFAARTTSGHLGSSEGLPVGRVLKLLREAGRLTTP
ncbi:MAG: S58 family peptidase [Gemmatimonadales bacterium]|nr:MAG: S58 family peptidase [Gemmatimonadales bacterium]